METYENIDRELEKRGMSRRKLAISIGVPPSTFQSMMERKRGMTLELLKKIADALGMSIYSLADFDLASEAVTEEINANRRESQLLSHFRNLNDNGQSVAVERVQELTQIPAYQRPAGAEQTAPTAPDDKDPAEK